MLGLCVCVRGRVAGGDDPLCWRNVAGILQSRTGGFASAGYIVDDDLVIRRRLRFRVAVQPIGGGRLGHGVSDNRDWAGRDGVDITRCGAVRRASGRERSRIAERPGAGPRDVLPGSGGHVERAGFRLAVRVVPRRWSPDPALWKDRVSTRMQWTRRFRRDRHSLASMFQAIGYCIA